MSPVSTCRRIQLACAHQLKCKVHPQRRLEAYEANVEVAGFTLVVVGKTSVLVGRQIEASTPITMLAVVVVRRVVAMCISV